MKKTVLCLLLILAVGGVFAQNAQDSLALKNAVWKIDRPENGFEIKSVSLRIFNSYQQFTLLVYNPDRYSTRVVQAEKMARTSDLAAAAGASGAVNGSFYNMKSGWPVAFVRSSGTAYGPVSLDNRLLNGAVVIRNRKVKVVPWNSSTLLSVQTAYPDVMQAGPLLVSDKKAIPIVADPGMAARHPRTAIGLNREQVLFLVADGRHPGHADGLSLVELAWLMRQIGCTDALNLDGGGSSTLWAHGAVRNYPSDNRRFDHEGERSVANVILITKE